MPVTRKKTFEIVKSGKRDVLEVEGKTLCFNRRGVATTDDAGIAAAVEERYGIKSKRGDGSAVVIPLEAYNEHRDRRNGSKNQNYFTVGAMPWHRYDENGNRIN